LAVVNHGGVSADSRPSYEELVEENAELKAALEQLRAEIAELRRQLGLNSQNSSKPPSTDSPFDKPAPKPRSLRKKTGRKPGGQPGHTGVTLELVDNPKHKRRYEPSSCKGCGADLVDAPEVGVVRRQVFDLPPIAIEVTEHQLVSRRCDCGIVTCADAPAGVTAPTQYGPRVVGIAVYLHAGQFLPKARTAQALTDLFGTPISQGTIATMTKRAAHGLGGFLERVRRIIAGAAVAGFDETGFRVGSKLRWVHCARTDTATLLTCHDKRGCDGIDDAAVLPEFKGVAVRDAWAPYDSYTDAQNQLCNAHVLRELAAVAETTDPDPDTGWCWATQAADALVAIQHLCTEAINSGALTLDPQELAEQVKLYRHGAQIGINANADRANELAKKHHALAKRLINRQDDYLRFTTDWAIPPDNNGSERDIRMVKLRQKISGCMRTLTGAQHFCAIRSYLSTATKQGRNHLEVLAMLAEGQPWLPAIP
jgi:transposase